MKALFGGVYALNDRNPVAGVHLRTHPPTRNRVTGAPGRAVGWYRCCPGSAGWSCYVANPSVRMPGPRSGTPGRSALPTPAPGSLMPMLSPSIRIAFTCSWLGRALASPQVGWSRLAGDAYLVQPDGMDVPILQHVVALVTLPDGGDVIRPSRTATSILRTFCPL